MDGGGQHRQECWERLGWPPGETALLDEGRERAFTALPLHGGSKSPDFLRQPFKLAALIRRRVGFESGDVRQFQSERRFLLL